MTADGGRGQRVMVLERERHGDLGAVVSLVAEVLPTTNEDDLLGRIHRERVDAVLIDAMVPKVDAVNLVSELHGRQKPTRFLPILVAVDRSEVILKEDLLNAGATDVIDTPVEAAEARNRLSHMLRARGWHAQLAEAGATLDRERRETTAARRELLPHDLPLIQGWDFAARVRHMGRFTGDSYDLFPVSPDRVVVSVADALGSDVVSLIRLAMVRAWVRNAAHRADSVRDVLNELNKMMLDTFGDDGRFVTLYIGFLNPQTAMLVHGCAGFVEPLLWGNSASSGGSPKLEGGPPIGVTRDAAYGESALKIEPGIRLILGTHALQRERRAPGSLAGRVAAGGDISASMMAETLAVGEPHPSAVSSSGMRDVTFLVIHRKQTAGS